jgi:hypothetical protein
MPRPSRFPSAGIGGITSLILCGSVSPIMAATMADEMSDLRDALCFGKTSGAARYRYERVHQDNITNEASASTVRLALGYETKPFYGLSGFAQFEGVYALDDDSYRTPTNNRTTYPRVNDTPTTELNQGYGKYVCPLDPWKTTVKYGRQEYLLGNQRMVGNVAWRQDTQVFDGVSASSTPLGGPEQNLTVGYAYFSSVHRIFPDSVTVNPFEGRLLTDLQIVNGTYRWTGIGALSGYGVLLDYNTNVAAVKALSSQTYGVRLEGPWKINDDWSVVYAAEIARQLDYGSNASQYEAAYSNFELGVGFKTTILKGGYQVLQGHGANDKFTTPLATGHAFNGWAEIFLNTPNNGLTALSISAESGVPWINGLSLAVIYYDFSSETGDQHFGHEVDARVEYRVIPFDKNLLLGVKVGDFIGDEIATLPAASTADNVYKLSFYTQYSF